MLNQCLKNSRVDASTALGDMDVIGASSSLKNGIQRNDFVTNTNYKYLYNRVNKVLSADYKSPVVVHPDTLLAVMRYYSTLHQSTTVQQLNDKVVAQIRLMMRYEQREIREFNEYDDEEFAVLSKDPKLFNSNPTSIKIFERRAPAFIEI